ncbi:mfs amine [Moniliophthora roreri MCA 2997]|uniref:Mfs amine n=1 Tax=Moniliophthora roreri (strain MCA 2997) TaxID=1381753 RepID=V2WGA6_MONRO|nr:mfs amine [Moniliophthora roreri MCA 2997]
MGFGEARFLQGSRPIGLEWRAGYGYVTFVVCLGIAVDLLVYSIIVPVMPFQLEKLGYDSISSLTGWLLFSYSAGLAITTFPIAMWSERYNARQWPLILGILLLIGSIIMLMEAPKFWLMVIARVLQGVGSTMVWVVGLALLCDTAPERIVGRQLGFTMSGMSIGFFLGPPVGGALYKTFGFRGVCIFGVIVAFVDLVARLLVIERKEALRYGFDPHRAVSAEEPETEEPETEGASTTEQSEKKTADVVENRPEQQTESSDESKKSEPQLSLIAVVIRLLRSSRAVGTVICLFVYGIVNTAVEPALPIHMNEVWNFDSTKVGLIFIAAVVPSFPSSAIAGYLTDRWGTPSIVIASLILSIPWWFVLTVNTLGLFIVAFALEFFFISAALPPLTAELAEVSKQIEGIGYAHVYAFFNLAYGIGSTVGPIIGGQIFDNLGNGWFALCAIAAGWLALGTITSFFLIGEKPIFKQLSNVLRRKHEDVEAS